MKNCLEVYFIAGKRIPASSKDGNQRDGSGDTPSGKSGGKVEPNAEKGGERDKDNTARSTPTTKKETKALRKESACNTEHQNKKARSDDNRSGEEDSKQVRMGSVEKGGG